MVAFLDFKAIAANPTLTQGLPSVLVGGAPKAESLLQDTANTVSESKRLKRHK